MKIISLVIIALLSTAYCCDDTHPNPGEGEQSCAEGSNPSWIAGAIDGIKAQGYQGEIIRYRYKGEFVFYVNGCLQCSDFITFVYNCEGKELCKFGGFAGYNTCPDFTDEATDPVVIWKN